MKIKQDLLHITNQPLKDDGTPAEPEEQTASRILTTDAEVTGSLSGGQLGSIASSIVAAVPVHEFARAVRNPCANCRYFDGLAFQAFIAKADHPAAPMHVRESVNNMRAALLQTMNASVNAMHAGMDGDMDVEHALRALGFCRALGENMGEPVIVHPLTSCPPEVITPEQPNGLFKPRDRASEAAGDKAFDHIMARAAGKEV